MKKDKSKNTRLLPNSLRIISSCIKTVSTNASTVVRSAGSSVAASISGSGDDQKDQVTWAGFDKLKLATAAFRNVLLLGYQNGFQVIDAEDASNFSELVSKRDGPVTFLQILPVPLSSSGSGGFRSSHPLLLVVAGDKANGSNLSQNRAHMNGSGRDGSLESKSRNSVNSPMAVRFYSLSSKCYVQVIQFQSAVYMVRCSPLIVAVGLESQIYCIDALTLEKKTTIATYPISHGGQGTFGVNVGYGPMAVGPRWLAYASVNPIVSNTGRLSPVNLIPAISPSSSPANGSLVARYAMESSKQLAAGIINLGDKGYRTISNSPVRFAAPETVHAGTVVVYDVASGVTLSQFKAHTSPISALCFDPSGTLLVTASVNGNSMNVFRIMPSVTHGGSGNQSSDWSSSHVHLYKLHRGMTSAIIQDICFSRFSQWVAIVSSKGTCHIFVLFPFGGHAGLQTFDSFGNHPAPSPVLSLPWWSNSPIALNQQSTPPPPPVTLSVVCRIKNNSSGLLNSVSNAAASAAGKVFVPSGAVAAVFHNSMPLSSENVHRRVNSLEHLLVYSPSGYVIQHELLPSFGSEPSDIGSKSRSSSNLHTQDVDSTVTVKPVQCWDVCRRSDTPEREECIFVTASDGREAADMIDNTNDSCGGEIYVKSNSIKSHEWSYWFLSNAEVQIISCKLPIWQNTKIVFYMMSPPRVESLAGREFEIEKVPCHEVEIKRKDLLPVYDPFHSISSDWNGRTLSGRYPPPSILRSHHTRDKVTDETVICHSKPASLSSTESSEGGSSRRTESLLDLDQLNNEKCGHKLKELSLEQRGCKVLEPSILDQKSTATESYPSEYSKNKDFHAESDVLCDRRAVGIIGDLPLVDTGGVSRVPMSTTSRCDSAMDILAKVQEKPAAAPSCVKRPVDIEHCFQEGYYNASEPDGCPKSVKAAITNVASGNDHYNGEKSDCDGEDEELLGGMFDFSEDGRDPNY